jgi:hypothetical protein
MDLKPNRLDTMQKCIAKTKELCAALDQAGCRVYRIENIEVFDNEDRGAVKLDVTLDFRQADTGVGTPR